MHSKIEAYTGSSAPGKATRSERKALAATWGAEVVRKPQSAGKQTLTVNMRGADVRHSSKLISVVQQEGAVRAL